MILLDGQLNGKPAVLRLDTGANNSVVVYRAAGLDGLIEVKLSLEHRSWLNRRVCIMDLSDASRRMGTRIDGFVGQLLWASLRSRNGSAAVGTELMPRRKRLPASLTRAA